MALSRRLGGAFAAVSIFGVVTVSGTSVAVTAPNVQRIAGATRIATAIATSQDEFASAGSATAVVLARADTFPDALAGGPLAAKLGGPLLLTLPARLDPSVLAEVERVVPAGGWVYLLGGTSAIGPDVVFSLVAAGFKVIRLDGADRYATAVQIADAMGDPTTVFEATGTNYPDALAAGPAAIKAGAAILLTNGEQQAPATAAYLAAHPGGPHYALGGPAAKADPSATAVVGDDRFSTSTLVAARFFPGATTAGFATGFNFPDALAAGPDLASKSAPLVLLQGAGALPSAPARYLIQNSGTVTTAIVFGGTASVTVDVATQLAALVEAKAQAAVGSTETNGRYGAISEIAWFIGSGAPGAPASSTARRTIAVDGVTGDATTYTQGAAKQTGGTEATRAQLNALPLDNPASLKSAVNAMFASSNATSGISGDPDSLFAYNADSILSNPVASASLRWAMYVALTEVVALNPSDPAPPTTAVQPQTKDSAGRVGMAIWVYAGGSFDDGLRGPAGNELSDAWRFVFDPATSLPLEDTTYDKNALSGAHAQDDAAFSRTTVLSITTSDAFPPDPYS